MESKSPGVAIQGGVSGEAEVLGVGGTGGHVVEEDHAVVVLEVRDEMLPEGLVCGQTVTQDHYLLAHPHHANVVNLQKRWQLRH
jgi:hypothetical protein